jgi:hypothetical protein
MTLLLIVPAGALADSTWEQRAYVKDGVEYSVSYEKGYAKATIDPLGNYTFAMDSGESTHGQDSVSFANGATVALYIEDISPAVGGVRVGYYDHTYNTNVFLSGTYQATNKKIVIDIPANTLASVAMKNTNDEIVVVEGRYTIT